MTRRLLRRIAIAGLGVAAYGCVTAPVPLPRVPSLGGPHWTELTSKHFTMWTDASPGRGRELVAEMEQLRQVVLGVAFPRAEADDRILVIAFRNAEEVSAFVPSQFIAFSWSGRGGIKQPLVVVNADDETDQRILTHELVHVISYAVVQDQPHWFAEGLAGYFETMKFNGARSTVEVGLPIDFMLRRVRDLGLTPVESMFSCADPACMDDRYYASTWAVMSYLFNVRPDELLRYEARLAELPEEQQAAAWAEVFPRLTADVLEHEVREWFAHGSRRVSRFNVKLNEAPISERAIGDAEVYAARGVLRYYFKRDGVEPPEIASALKADATNLVAQLVRASSAHSADPDVARTLAAAHPGDWRAWWMLGVSLRSGPEAETARVKVCELSSNPMTLPAGMCAPRAPSKKSSAAP